MVSPIKLSHIHDKHLNFLIGAGASAGLFPTLSLDITNEKGERHTVETLATLLEDDKKKQTALFMHYYLTCIKPVIEFQPKSIRADAKKSTVLANYKTFIKTILTILQRKNESEKKANIFTTNYDGCFAFAGDSVLQDKNLDFVLNDGTSGFFKRTLQAHNFSKLVTQNGIFERNQTALPQLNLIHVHGSAYWQNASDHIEVDYQINHNSIISNRVASKISDFQEVLGDFSCDDSDLPTPNFSEVVIDDFWAKYKKLPIVNPTKWKFHETVFEEHYYQMLRMLSYELERPNSVLITFGFSFADEHVLNLVKRSLVNPTLKVYVCSYSSKSAEELKGIFSVYPNVEIIGPDGGDKIDFTKFNSEIFTIDAGAGVK